VVPFPACCRSAHTAISGQRHSRLANPDLIGCDSSFLYGFVLPTKLVAWQESVPGTLSPLIKLFF